MLELQRRAEDARFVILSDVHLDDADVVDNLRQVGAVVGARVVDGEWTFSVLALLGPLPLCAHCSTPGARCVPTAPRLVHAVWRMRAFVSRSPSLPPFHSCSMGWRAVAWCPPCLS